MLLLVTGCKKDDETYTLYTKYHNLIFDYDENRVELVFSNISDSDITWIAESADDFIYFDKDNGILGSQVAESIDIILNRELISADSISTKVRIVSSKGDDIEIKLVIYNYPENKIRLGYNTKDAAYSKNLNKLFLLPQGNAGFFDVFNVSDRKFERVDIPGNLYLDNLTISYNDKYIGLCGDKYLLLYDITSKKILGEHFIGTEISSIVFAPGNKVYIFPGYSGVDVYCLNIETGNLQEFDIPNYYDDDLIAKLHPSEKYIYAIDDYSTGLMKFSIINTEPELIYDEYLQSIRYKLWFSDDGTKIFSQTNTYLNIDAELPGNDIISEVIFDYNYGYINDMSYSAIKHEYYFTPDYDSYTQTNRLLVYDETLNLKETLYSEDFIYRQNGQVYYAYQKALINRVFAGNSNSELILITEAENGNYSSYGEAIELIAR